MNPALDECFPAESGVRIIAEPGRYMVTKAFRLCCNVFASRDCRVSSEDSMILDASGQVASKAPVEFMYYINDGVYGSFNCLIYDHAVAEPHYIYVHEV